MDYLGIHLDENLNAERSKKLRELQSENSRVKIMVIPTNEELEIANQVYDLIQE